MINGYAEKQVIIFEGQVNLLFIKEGFLKVNFSNYEVILIDCNESVMAKRLVVDRNQPDILTENMKNWLNYLHNQANTLKIPIIDTSDKTKIEVVETFEKVILD